MRRTRNNWITREDSTTEHIIPRRYKTACEYANAGFPESLSNLQYLRAQPHFQFLGK